MPSFHDFFARDEDKNMVLEFCNGLGGGHYFREGMPFLTANAKAVGLPRKIFVEGLKNAPGELADYWKESLSNREIAELTRGPKRPSDDAATTNPSKKVMLTKSEIAVATAAEPSHVAPKEKTSAVKNGIDGVDIAVSLNVMCSSLPLPMQIEILQSICRNLVETGKSSTVDWYPVIEAVIVMMSHSPDSCDISRYGLEAIGRIIGVDMDLYQGPVLSHGGATCAILSLEMLGEISADVAEWAFNALCSVLCTNREAKDELGTMENCRLMMKVLQTHVPPSGSPEAHSGVATMGALCISNMMMQLPETTNKDMFRELNAASILGEMSANNPSLSKKARDSLNTAKMKIESNYIPKFLATSR